MTTNDALALLKELGADPAREEARRAIGLVRERITWFQLDGRPFFDGETEACINGRILAAGACFGADCDRLRRPPARGAARGRRLELRGPAQHAILVPLHDLRPRGLLAYEKAQGPKAAVTEAQARAQGYLLERRCCGR